MKPIWLFLTDFRGLVKDTLIRSQENVHSVFYYEDVEEGRTWFYKPVGSVLYYVSVVKEDLKDVTLRQLKQELKAMEIREQLVRPKILSINNVPIGTIR